MKPRAVSTIEANQVIAVKVLTSDRSVSRQCWDESASEPSDPPLF